MRRLIGFPLLLLLGGCGTVGGWFGEAEEPPLPGERLSILALEQRPEADPRIADLQVRLPRPQRNEEWPQTGGYPNHAMHHLEVPGALDRLWKVDIGAGGDDERWLLSTPVIAEGRVFAIDAEGEVGAYDAASGKLIWRASTLNEDEDAFGGGIAYGGGRIYVGTGAGEALALDASDGSEIWRVRVGAPVRAAPTLSDGRLFVLTYDNQLYALDASDGRQLWSHSGIAETVQLLGAASPAVSGGKVIVAYSSGEVFALRTDNGRVAWSDALAFGRRTGSLEALGDINGSPVVDRDRVYAVSHAGRLVAIALNTGVRLWDQALSGVQTPWIAGDFLFVVTTGGDLLCLSRRDGRIRWVSALPRFEDPDDETDPIFWSGPILVSDRLIVVGSNGAALSVSPYTGEVLGSLVMPGAVDLPPVAANGTVYVLTNDAQLVALR